MSTRLYPKLWQLTLLGGTNHQLDLQNPDNLGQQATDNGVVPNLKWSFSDSKTRIFNGGWVREQVITDLPQRFVEWHRIPSMNNINAIQSRHLRCATAFEERCLERTSLAPCGTSKVQVFAAS